MAQQVLEGTWEEIAAHADELVGKRIKVTVEADALPTAVQPNMKMLDAMRAAEEIQQGMNPAPESDGVAIIREGRRGAMYGDDPAD
jgi:hypothetical protein